MREEMGGKGTSFQEHRKMDLKTDVGHALLPHNRITDQLTDSQRIQLLECSGNFRSPWVLYSKGVTWACRTMNLVYVAQ